MKGIIPNLERRYKETDSVTVREELAKYLNSQICPECAGTRLRREARHVRVGGQAIYEINALPLKEAKAFFDQVNLTGHKHAIAEKIIKEISSRIFSSTMSGWITCRWIAPLTPSPVENPSVSGLPARSDQV